MKGQVRNPKTEGRSPRPGVRSPQARLDNRELAGFSRVDLAVVVAVAALLAAWFGFSHSGERGRIARCARNLGVLGEAIDSYANDHNDGIPAGAINLGGAKTTWDVELFRYLEARLAKASGAYEKRQLLLAAQPFFFCPSDPVQRGGHPRSYAMAARDMAYGWPPGPDDKTGVGLFWASSTLSVLDEGLAQRSVKDPELLPRLQRSVLPEPAGTLLLTELMAPDNLMAEGPRARVFGVGEQEAVFKQAPGLHRGRFNYLMADGHVAWLTRLQTGGQGGRGVPGRHLDNQGGRLRWLSDCA